jgi:hypothetical protein
MIASATAGCKRLLASIGSLIPSAQRRSKKVENHAAAIALYFMWYNFGRVHQTLRVTPAMDAGVTDHVWSVEKIGNLLGA